ncbi:hypothetical protein P5815_30380 [Bacillus cereus]|uniref:hypothetical protein n=1 Tax=Bacillus cereus TaxID=1396 RepID=UPI0024052ED8|nr:hypothetical protein [Bacillus cereus]MCU5065390.1 hypothetical protein [Bacillus cereus]MDF9524807.1 hypothetical protein [Bacillus cereus]MDF9564486.1 hypothetical protein [Bacillus cereus]
MLIKAYIKKHMFHLPTLDNQILEAQVEQALNKKVDKSRISKLYPLTKIEDNENILIEKQHTNIFLLNLLLLVLNHNKKDITAQEYYNDVFITSKLEEETNLILEHLSFDELEKNIMEYVTSSETDEPSEVITEVIEMLDQMIEENEEGSVFKNVEFSLNWLEKAQKELNRRD